MSNVFCHPTGHKFETATVTLYDDFGKEYKTTITQCRRCGKFKD